MLLYLDHITFIGFLDPFGGLLLDMFLSFSLDRCSFGTGSDLLDVGNFSGDHVYRQLFFVSLDRTLVAIFPILPAIIARCLTIAA